MRVVGWTVVIAGIVGAFLLFGGYVDVDGVDNVEVDMTSKGKQTISDGLNHARNGIDKIDPVKESAKKPTKK